MTTANASTYYVDRHIAEGRASRPALVTRDGSWSYGQLLDEVQRAGFMLCAAGVRPLDRVAIVLPDTPAAAAILFGAMRIGAIPVPLHLRLSHAEHAFICQDAHPRAAVVGADHAERMLQIRAETGWPEVVVVDDDAALPDDAVSARPLMRGSGRSDAAATRPDDIALLQYTSGSTGRPKGVVHLHRGLLALPAGFGRRLGLGRDDRCFSAAKLAFGYGLGNSLLFPLAAGASAFLRAEPSEPLGVLETIQDARPTVVFAGPSLYAAMLTVRDASASFDTSSVRLFVSAGEALGASLFERWKQAFGRPILDGLGSTECLHIFIAGEPGDLRPGRVGTVVPPYEVRLLDDAGTPVSCGPGHVHVAGPATAAGYWGRNGSHDWQRDGWVRTGDVMERAADGAFVYLGRSDDVFKVHGMKVAPLEIESRLDDHPAVTQSVVVPATDGDGRTITCAFVRLRPHVTPSPELGRALRAHVRAAMSAHKVPRIVRFVEELPRNGAGKVSRPRLREQANELVGRGERLGHA